MWDTTGELWIQTRITASFWYDILCILTTRNSKATGCIWMFYISNEYLQSEMPISVLELDARYELWVMIPNMHHSLCPINHLCIVTCIMWKLEVICGRSAYRTTAILSETFFVRFRFAWEIWLESYGLTHASDILWYHIVCIYCKPICTVYIAIWCASIQCMTTELTYLITAYYTPNNDFTANDASSRGTVVPLK